MEMNLTKKDSSSDIVYVTMTGSIEDAPSSKALASAKKIMDLYDDCFKELAK